MTRIIGGSARGRHLRTPAGDATRPTSDRVREALFSAVESWAGVWSGLRVLDLYAGSGAVGLEAFSRGAEAVTFVEKDRRTAALIVANADLIGLDRPDVRASSVGSVVGRDCQAAYDLVFLDPPYPLPEPDLAAVLRALVTNHWLAGGALVVVERSTRGAEPTWPAGLEVERHKKYGETTLWFARAAD